MAKAQGERRLTERELLAYRAEFRNGLFRQIHRRLRELKEGGATQAQLANRLGMDPGQLSKVLRGDTDIRLETLSDLARALGCRISTQLRPIDQHVAQANISATIEWPDGASTAELTATDVATTDEQPRIHPAAIPSS